MQREKELKAQRDQDERLLEARKLAGMGFSVAEIEEELKRIKMVRCIPFGRSASLPRLESQGLGCTEADWLSAKGLAARSTCAQVAAA